jgi:hypothetical protein
MNWRMPLRRIAFDRAIVSAHDSGFPSVSCPITKEKKKEPVT